MPHPLRVGQPLHHQHPDALRPGGAVGGTRIRLAPPIGGQRTLRPYWRNYFEQTDALVWVVDSGDRMRMRDCKEELHSLLLEDVSSFPSLALPLLIALCFSC